MCVRVRVRKGVDCQLHSLVIVLGLTVNFLTSVNIFSAVNDVKRGLPARSRAFETKKKVIRNDLKKKELETNELRT